MKRITQSLKWLVTLLAMIVCTGAWAQEVSYDFTKSGWSVSNGTLTDGTVSFTGAGGTNFKMNNGYFMMGKKDAYINFPIYDFAVEKIEVVGNSGASADTKMNLFVGSTAVSTETTGSKGTNTYVINSDYQQAGTQYTLKVTSSHNAQITAIKIYKASGVVTTITISDEKLTNKDIYAGTNAGKLIATVKEGDTTIDNPSITWTSSNTSVATVGAMGAVTLVAAGTTTITAEYKGATAEYELEVTSSAPQITDFTVTLNNTFFGTEYSGTASGITDDNPVNGTKNNVNIVYAGGGNHYINNSQTRFYPNNKLTFTAPEGYIFTKIEFTKSGTWACTINSEVGTVTGNTTWTGQANEVVLTGSGTSRCDMTDVAITLAKQNPYTLTIGDCENAEIYVFYKNDQTNSIANSNDMITNDHVLSNSDLYISASAKEGYVLESVTVTDGNGNNISLTEEEEGITWTFIMPESDVTVSCTVKPLQKFTFVKVTSNDELTDGEYLIVYEYEEGSVAFNGGLETLDAANNTIGVTISDNDEIEGNETTGAATFTIDVAKGSIKSASGYYIGVTSYSNGLTPKENDFYTNTIEIANNGNANITLTFDGGTMALRYNSDSNQKRFRYYRNSGQQPIQLYKKVVEEPKPITIDENTTLAVGKYATRIYPFAPKAMEGITFYSCKAVNGTSLTLSKVTELKANTPYILGNDGEGATEAISIKQTGVDKHEEDTYTDGYLTGVFAATTVPEGSYVLQTQNEKQAFYKVEGEFTINTPYRAYLTVPTDVAGNVKAFNLGVDEATAINTLDVLTSGAYEGIYSVDGVKLNRIEKGVNILKMVDGTTRKVIVK